MAFAAISDVHSNLAALRAVLAHIEASGLADEIYFLGDAVGYGPDPNECVSLLCSTCEAFVAGNALGAFHRARRRTSGL